MTATRTIWFLKWLWQSNGVAFCFFMGVFIFAITAFAMLPTEIIIGAFHPQWNFFHCWWAALNEL